MKYNGTNIEVQIGDETILVNTSTRVKITGIGPHGIYVEGEYEDHECVEVGFGRLVQPAAINAYGELPELGVTLETSKMFGQLNIPKFNMTADSEIQRMMAEQDADLLCQLGVDVVDPQAKVAKVGQFGPGPTSTVMILQAEGLGTTMVSGPEFDAILAGLALLREAIPSMKFSYDSIASQCWTNGGEHDGLSVEAVQALADRLNHGE